MLRFITSGESHGPCLIAIVEGLPANLSIDDGYINSQLSRRQGGYGRGGRMKIEKDKVQFKSGLRFGLTTGAPLTLMVENKDWTNWQEKMSHLEEPPEDIAIITRPRPGHADLAGGLKYNQKDLRNILERASARETAIKVAIGSIAREFLAIFNIHVYSYVICIGGVRADSKGNLTPKEIYLKAEKSPVRCSDEGKEKEMIAAIETAKGNGDSLGGIFEVIATGVPVGLGSHVQWDRKLDGNIARSFMSLQAIKGVEIGLGMESGSLTGSNVHDEIYYHKARGYYRKTNRAGGLEGGISNGEDIVVRAAMKPIPTLYAPLKSVDMLTKEEWVASVERSDACAVPAASVTGEALLAWELAVAFNEKFAGDSLEEVKDNYYAYLEKIKKR